MAKVWKYLRRHWMLYAMLIPGLSYIIIFKYIHTIAVIKFTESTSSMSSKSCMGIFHTMIINIFHKSKVS